MRHWFTQADLRLSQTVVKRFDPAHWTIDFPRGSMGSVVSRPGEMALEVNATFARKGDLVGLIFLSEDRHVHVAHRRATDRDYSRCTLRFRWRSAGVMPLDSVNGPTLTIEGRDSEGAPRTWYVRLWNYASGSPQDATITLPFDTLDGGFRLPEDSVRVDVRAVDRMFITLVPPAYSGGSQERLPTPVEGWVEISEIDCSGSGSVVAIADGLVPEHEYGICTAYDDCYHLTPERVIDSIERLGYREIINHYVGMSHYPALAGDGRADPARTICVPARRWHESFAAIAAERGYKIIWSVSFELLESLCPEPWKQRAFDGSPGRTGYLPPSNLLSPAVPGAMSYLGAVTSAFAQIGIAAGMPALVQVGEPWWWVTADNAICIYDDAARALWPEHQAITDVRDIAGQGALRVMEQAGAVLSAATSGIVAAVRADVGELTSYVLPYLPSVLRTDAPALELANLPSGWAAPTFDVLQLEDYEWAAGDQVERSRSGLRHAAAKLNYPKERCQYLAGFVPTEGERAQWGPILRAAARAEKECASKVLIWALPQVLRDGLTIFAGEAEVESYRDIEFPAGIGSLAWVEPQFSNSIHLSASGFESRNVNWAQARLRFDVGPGVRSIADLQILLAFFRSVRGNAVAFRFRDPLDHSSADMTGVPSATDMLIGVGDGITRRFPLVKKYGEGEVRRITRPVGGTVKVALQRVQNTSWSLSEGGTIEFADPPAMGVKVTAGFLFDVVVRFEEEQLRVSRKTHLAGEAVSVPLIEVKEG